MDVMALDKPIELFLDEVVAKKASDIHIMAGATLNLRIDGDLVPSSHCPDYILTPEDSRKLCHSIIREQDVKTLEENREFDSSFDFQGKCRFRVNLFFQLDSVAGALRPIPQMIPTMAQLGLPDILKVLTQRPRGLVLVTGPTGSGKSTSLAAMIGEINHTRAEHIVTMEDPIEFVHTSAKSVIAQREVGKDTHSFQNALKYVLRQDPDVVLVGELRDYETMSAAITISETGHLVFGTLHTNTAVQTINRIINVFPAHQQAQIRTQLSFVLEGVISQQLVPKISGGRYLAQEIMIPTLAIRNLIREDKIHQIYTSMQINQTQSQMTTMNQSLAHGVKKGHISKDEAMGFSTDLEEMKKLIGA